LDRESAFFQLGKLVSAKLILKQVASVFPDNDLRDIEYAINRVHVRIEEAAISDTNERPANVNQQLQAAIALVREAANNDYVSAVAFSRFNNVLLTIEQRAAV